MNFLTRMRQTGTKYLTLSGVILRHKPKNNKWNEEIFAHHRDYDSLLCNAR